MDTKQLVAFLGGQKQLRGETGLSKGRISQWVRGDRITPAWEKYFRAKYPDLDWASYDARFSIAITPSEPSEAVQSAKS